MTDISSCSFGKIKMAWLCFYHNVCLVVFSTYPSILELPHLSFGASNRIVFIFQIKAVKMEGWHFLPRPGDLLWARDQVSLTSGNWHSLTEGPLHLLCPTALEICCWSPSNSLFGTYCRWLDACLGQLRTSHKNCRLWQANTPVLTDVGWVAKMDPKTTKKLLEEADIPECSCQLVTAPTASKLKKAVGDLTIVAFYYLLQVGEYTCKGTRNNTKQTV